MAREFECYELDALDGFAKRMVVLNRAKSAAHKLSSKSFRNRNSDRHPFRFSIALILCLQAVVTVRSC